MFEMRESWTDERLDDFRSEVNRRFDEVYRRFDEVDRRFDEVEGELQRVNDRLDGMQRTMVHGLVVMTGAILASNAALIGLFATQL